MGSLITALASYLDIKQRAGKWFVRIDNLDPPRQDPNATAEIITSLKAHGLVWDLPLDYQSDHQQRYHQAFDRIKQHLFYCGCTRKQTARFSVYPGTCRGQLQPMANTAVRVKVGEEVLSFTDGIQGLHNCRLAAEPGDFIVKRRDGLWAYNFATALDDGFDTTHVLRGQDLAHVTAPQIYVMALLGLERPTYAHLPLLCFTDGTKLSKQTHAPGLSNPIAAKNLQQAMYYLGQSPPQESDWNVDQWLAWGLKHWRLDQVPQRLPHYLAGNS